MAAPDNRTTPWTFVLDEPLRILVVDDDPILREFASVYLGTPSATIETACDGVVARMRLGQAAYDALLLDIEMPQLDGFSLLEEIRSDERLRHLPVIMLTGHDDIASIDASSAIRFDTSFARAGRKVCKRARMIHCQNQARDRRRERLNATSAVFCNPSFIVRTRSSSSCRSTIARDFRNRSWASAYSPSKLFPNTPRQRGVPLLTALIARKSPTSGMRP